MADGRKTPPPAYSAMTKRNMSQSPDQGQSSSVPPLSKSRTEGSTHPSAQTSFEDDWKVLQNIPTHERRELYTCTKYTMQSDIVTWCLTGKLSNRVIPDKKDRKFIGKYSFQPDLNKKVAMFEGDVTGLEIDCIVNAANTSLLGGGGVDGAIHRAAGKSLLKQCKTLNGCGYGDAKLTYGYKLPATYVIHTVGPLDGNPDTLESAYRESLKLAMKENIRSIAFPCIATGVYGFPNDKAASIALRVVREVLEKHGDRFDLIIFCVFLQVDVNLYKKFMKLVFPLEE